MLNSLSKEEKQGAIGTILLHLLLLLLFMLFGLTRLIPPPDKGILLNFGTSDQGMGDQQPTEVTSASTPPQENTPEPQENVEPVAEEVQEEVITQNTEETVKVPTAEEIAAEKKRKEEEERKKKEEEAKKKAESLWEKVNQNQQANQGETGQPGDQGSPEGDPEAGAYSGVPGTGNSPVGLGGSGRSWTEVKPQGVQNEQGRVEVLVFVDSNGNVKKASIHKSTNPVLNPNALNAAYKWKFSERNTGNKLQKIIIPFVFTF